MAKMLDKEKLVGIKFVSEPLGNFSMFKQKKGRAKIVRGNTRSRHRGKGSEARERNRWMKKCL